MKMHTEANPKVDVSTENDEVKFSVDYDPTRATEIPLPNVNPQVRVSKEGERIKLQASYSHVNISSKNPLVDEAYKQRAQKSYEAMLLRKQKPLLSKSVIEGVSLYQSKQHQAAISSWLKNTSDLNQCDENGNTVAHLAALHGHNKLLCYFINKGVNPNCENDASNNVLIALLEKLFTAKDDLNSSQRNKIYDCIKSCLALKVETNHPLGKSALTMALFTDNITVVKLLIDNGVDVNEQGIMGYPLSAAKVLKSHPEIIALLESHQARENDFDITANI